MKKIKIFILIAISFLASIAISPNTKSKAATSNINEWTDLGGNSSIQYRVCITQDFFVNSNYSNTITSVPSNGVCYMTTFIKVNSGDFNSGMLQWNFDTSEQAKLSAVHPIIYNSGDAYSNVSTYCSDTILSLDQTSILMGLMTNNPSTYPMEYGRDNSAYFDGNSAKYCFQNDVNIDGYDGDTTKIQMIYAGKDGIGTLGIGTYIGAKYRLEFNSGVSSFSAKNVQSYAYNKAGTQFGDDSATKELFSFSLGAASKSDKYTASVEVYERNVTGGNTITKSYSDLTPSNDFVFDYDDVKNYDIKISVDGGAGTITNLSGATQSSLVNGVYTLNVTNDVEQKDFTTVKFTANAECIADNPSKCKEYTIRIIRNANLTGLTLTKVDGQTDPILSLSNSSSTYNNTANKVTDTTNLDPTKTYYIWVANSVQKFKVDYTYNGAGSSINGTAQGNNVGSVQIPSSTVTFTIRVSADSSNASSASVYNEYSFKICKITEYTSLGSTTVVATDNTTTGTSNGTGTTTSGSNSTSAAGNALSTGGTLYKYNIAYADSNGTKISTVNVTQQTANNNNSTLYYSTDGGQTWSTPGKSGSNYTNIQVSLTEQGDGTATGSILYYVKDNTTGTESKISEVAITRLAGETDNDYDYIKVYKYDNNQKGSLISGTWDINNETYDLGEVELYNYPGIYIEVKAKGTYAVVYSIDSNVKDTNSAYQTYTYTTSNLGEITYDIVIRPQSGNDATYYVKLKLVNNLTNILTAADFYVLSYTTTSLGQSTTNGYLAPDSSNYPTTDKDSKQLNAASLSGAVEITAPHTLIYTVPYNCTSVTLVLTATDGSIVNASGVAANLVLSDISQITAGNSQDYQFKVISQAGVPSSDYFTVRIHREKANSKAGLKTLEIKNGSGNVCTAYDSNTGSAFQQNSTSTNLFDSNNVQSYQYLNYYVNLGANQTTFTIACKEFENYNSILVAPITGIQSISQQYATNTITITSEDGLLIITYKIHIYSANDTNQLSSLYIDDVSTGTYLKDTSNNVVYNEGTAINTNKTPAAATLNYTSYQITFNYAFSNNLVFFRNINGSYSSYTSGSQVNLNKPQSGATTPANTIVKFDLFTELQGLRNQKEGISYSTFTPNQYVFEFNIEPSCGKYTLHTFQTSDGNILGFVADNASSTNITVENVSSSTLTFTFTKTCYNHDHDVEFDGTSVTPQGQAYTCQKVLSLSSTNTSETFYIKIYDEENNPLSYKITVCSGSATLDNTKKLGTTIISSYLGSVNSATDIFNATPTCTSDTNITDTATAVVGDKYLLIAPGLPANSKATIYVEVLEPNALSYVPVSLNASKKGTIQVTPSTTQDLIYIFKVYVIAENTVNKSSDHYIQVTIPQVSDVNTITDITVDTQTKQNPANDSYFEILKTNMNNCKFEFNLTDTNSTANVTPKNGVTYTPNNANDNTKGTLSNLALGLNTVEITVTSTSGLTNIYTVYIWVTEDTSLDNLEVDKVDLSKQYTLSPNFQTSVRPYSTTVDFTDTQERVTYTLGATLDSSLIKVTYRLGTDATVYSFNNSNGSYWAKIDLESTGNTIMYITVGQNYPSGTSFGGIQGSTTTYILTISKAQANTDADLLSVDIQGNLDTVNSYTNLSPSNINTIYLNRDTTSIEVFNVTHNGKAIDLSITPTVLKTAYQNTPPYGWTLSNGLTPNTKYKLTITIYDEQQVANGCITGTNYVFYLILADDCHDITDLKFADNLTNTIITDDNNDQINFVSTDTEYRYDQTNNVENPYIFSANGTYIRVYKSQYSYLYVDGQIVTDSYNKPYYDVAVNLSNVTAGNYVTVVLKVVSEAEKLQSKNPASESAEYKVHVGKARLDDNSSLHELTFTIVGLNNSDITSSATIDDTGVTYDQSGHYTINISNIGDAVSLIFAATPFKTTTFASYKNSTGQKGQTLTQTVNLTSSTSSGYIIQFTITSTAANGLTSTYTVNVARGPLDPSDDNTITGLQFYDLPSRFYVGEASVNPSVAVFDSINHVYPNPYSGYNILIPYGTTSFTINASLYAGSLATVKFTKDGQYVQNTSTYLYSETITDAMLGQTIEYIVQAVSDSGIAGSQYKFIVKFAEGEKNNSLDILTVNNGQNLINVTPTSVSTDGTSILWELPDVDYNTTSCDIYAYIADPTATILSSSQTGYQTLNTGLNVFTINVKAQNGDIKTYKISIKRLDKDPTLYDLSVTGSQLLDQNKVATTFDPNVEDYTVIIPYTQEYAEIVAKVTNPQTQTVSPGYTTNVYLAPGATVVKPITITDSLTSLNKTYRVTVIRLNEDTVNADLGSLVIEQLDGAKENLGDLTDKNTNDTFSSEYDKDKLHYGVYTVDNSISSLNVNALGMIHTTSAYCPNTATVEIYSGNSLISGPIATGTTDPANVNIPLSFGQNVVSIVVTAADGETKKVYDIVVYREPIAYEIDEEAIKEDGYKLTVNEDLIDYTIDIGSKKTHEVYFKEYIKLLTDVTDQDVTINYLTNIECDPDDVILELVTEDGISTLVTFHVESTGNSHEGSAFMDYLPLLIGLLIVIILLTCILISVNKDKYGKITRKADKKADKNQKDASKK